MCCKAILGAVGDGRFEWSVEDSARFVARSIPYAVVEVSDDAQGSWSPVGAIDDDRHGDRAPGAPQAGALARGDAGLVAQVADGERPARDVEDGRQVLQQVRAPGALQADLFGEVTEDA
jgi:hypothetical protein